MRIRRFQHQMPRIGILHKTRRIGNGNRIGCGGGKSSAVGILDAVLHGNGVCFLGRDRQAVNQHG